MPSEINTSATTAFQQSYGLDIQSNHIRTGRVHDGKAADDVGNGYEANNHGQAVSKDCGESSFTQSQYFNQGAAYDSFAATAQQTSASFKVEDLSLSKQSQNSSGETGSAVGSVEQSLQSASNLAGEEGHHLSQTPHHVFQAPPLPTAIALVFRAEVKLPGPGDATSASAEAYQ